MNHAKMLSFWRHFFLAFPSLVGIRKFPFLAGRHILFHRRWNSQIDWLDINFLSRELYRGSTRGIEITYVDLLVLSLLLAIFISARRENFRFYWPEGLGC